MDIRELDAPLHIDDQGVVRIGETNVLFDLVVRSYFQGHTPEEIVRQYTTLALSDVYGAISYFHQHRSQVEQYLRERDDEADRVRKELDRAGVAADAEKFLEGEEQHEANGFSADG